MYSVRWLSTGAMAAGAVGVLIVGQLLFAPSWLGRTAVDSFRRLRSSTPLESGEAAIGTEQVSRALLRATGAPTDGYIFQTIPVAQRRIRWHDDKRDLSSLVAFAEQLPREGSVYSPDPTLHVSSGYLQFLAALEVLPPSPNAGRATRQKRAAAQAGLLELQRAASAVSVSDLASGRAASLRRFQLAATSARTLVTSYGRALGGFPSARDIGLAVLAQYNPAQKMFVHADDIPEEVPLITTKPSLAEFAKSQTHPQFIAARPLEVSVACAGQSPETFVAKARFGVVAADILWIQRGQWFSWDLLNRYRVGFWSPEAPQPPEPFFFGADGRLRLVPEGLFVLRQPFVVLEAPARLSAALAVPTCAATLDVGGTTAWTILASDALSSTASPRPADLLSPITFELGEPDAVWVAGVLSKRPSPELLAPPKARTQSARSTR